MTHSFPPRRSSELAGAAKAVITPSQEQIDGITESRLYAGSKLQQFNLGGYGINPLQNLPNTLAQFGPSLTQPAQLPVYVSERFHETETPYVRVSVIELGDTRIVRSEEHPSEPPSLLRIRYAVFCLKHKQENTTTYNQTR